MFHVSTSPVNVFLGRISGHARKRTPLQSYGAAIVLPLLAMALTFWLAEMSQAPFFPLFTMAVVLASLFGGVGPGLLSVAESALINIVLVPPTWSFRIASSEDLVRIALFVITGTAIALLVGALGDLQNRLQLEHTQLLITLRGIGDAVIATDAAGKVAFMNPVAEQATGWTFAAAEGLPLEQVFPIFNERTRAAVRNPVREVIEKNCAIELANHTILVRPDGSEIPIDDSAAPIRDDQGRTVGVVLVFRDITHTKLQEAALKRSDRLSVAGRLASAIAHEINNPLEAVANLIYLVSQDDSLSEFSRAQIELAESELHRAVESSRRLLSFRRVEKNWTNINLRDFVDSVFELYKSLGSARKIQFRNEIGASCMVSVRPAEMRQLLSNLISNALDSMPNGGMLHVSCVVSAADGSLKLSISDTGPGIDPRHLNSIFEPFFTTKVEVGAGLGLWIAKRIAEDHDGRILVESTARGSTFSVILPLAGALPIPGANAPGLDLPGLRIH